MYIIYFTNYKFVKHEEFFPKKDFLNMYLKTVFIYTLVWRNSFLEYVEHMKYSILVTNDPPVLKCMKFLIFYIIIPSSWHKHILYPQA